MKYQEAYEYLQRISYSGIKPGLERLNQLLFSLGNPQEKCRFIHIAGTNGKGSTTHMIANILRNAGFVVGLYQSPYLQNHRENIQINGKWIEEADFAVEMAKIKRKIEKMEADDQELPTAFEVETALAFSYFKEKACDIVCLETGMGGRLDATNVIRQPLVTVITQIDRDHMNFLGEELIQIAEEKAGIIKGGQVVLYPLQQEETEAVIRKKCEENGAVLYQPSLTLLNYEETDWKYEFFVYNHLKFRKAMLGKFQIYNALTAYQAIQCLRKEGYDISDAAIQAGIEQTALIGRMEVIAEKPLILLDGGHNPAGARAAENILADLKRQNKRIFIIMGVLKDKEYGAMLASLAPYAEGLFAVPVNSERTLAPEELAERAKMYADEVTSCASSKEALDLVMKRMNIKDVLMICGSLYLAGEIRPLVQNIVLAGWKKS